MNAKSHSWQSCEKPFLLKKAIEAVRLEDEEEWSDYNQALEGMTLDNSLALHKGRSFCVKKITAA